MGPGVLGRDVGRRTFWEGESGDGWSIPCFTVADVPAAIDEIVRLGGDVIERGETRAICKDAEGSPFAVSAGPGERRGS